MERLLFNTVLRHNFIWRKAEYKLLNRIIIIGGSNGGGHQPGMRGPLGSKFFQFHAVFGQNLQNNPNLGVGAPPRENSGSATDYVQVYSHWAKAISFGKYKLFFFKFLSIENKTGTNYKWKKNDKWRG